MLNCYQLKLPTLSAGLNQELFALAQTLKAENGYDLINAQEINRDTQRWIEYHTQTNTSRTSYIVLNLSQILQSKLKIEMANQLFPISAINFYLQLITGGEKLMPHRDPKRTLSILYNISEDNATTHFYKTTSTDPDQHLYSLNEIEKTESYQMKPYKWYSFNNAAIHGVEGVYKNRVAITCDISAQPELGLSDHDTFCKIYNELLVHPDGLEPPTFAV